MSTFSLFETLLFLWITNVATKFNLSHDYPSTSSTSNNDDYNIEQFLSEELPDLAEHPSPENLPLPAELPGHIEPPLPAELPGPTGTPYPIELLGPTKSLLSAELPGPTESPLPVEVEKGYCIEWVNGGEVHKQGDRWTCVDGCNTCMCLENGNVAKTNRKCSVEKESGNNKDRNDGEGVSNKYIVGGDMVLDEIQVHKFKTGLISGTIDGVTRYGNETRTKRRYNAYNDKRRRWPNNTLSYSFDSDVPEWKKKIISEALLELHRRTGGCIKFRETDDGKRAVIRTENFPGMCQADVGYVFFNSNNQFITLGDRCIVKGTIQHEIIHALGIFHTQSRSDRDKYVNILEENIEDGQQQNFNEYDKNTVRDFGLPYNYGSIMHYHPKAFSKNQKPTIQSIDKSKQNLMGNRESLTKGDIELIERAYGCVEKQKVVNVTLSYCGPALKRMCQKLKIQQIYLKAKYKRRRKQCKRCNLGNKQANNSNECFVNQKSYLGDIIFSGNQGVTATAEECQKKCQNVVQCVEFIWKMGGGCYLKSTMGDPNESSASSSTFVTGPKYCSGDCQHKKGNGKDYIGSMSKTKSGLTCQKWTSQFPHKHGYGHLGNHNFCRNTNGHLGVWCYTTSTKRWEFCDVPVCGQSSYHLEVKNINSGYPPLPRKNS